MDKDKYKVFKFLITKQQKDLFKKFLIPKDYEAIEKQIEKDDKSFRNYKQKTIVAIVNQNTFVTNDNYIILEHLNIACYKKMCDARGFITNSIKELRKTPEVRLYNNLNDEDKWFKQ